MFKKGFKKTIAAFLVLIMLIQVVAPVLPVHASPADYNTLKVKFDSVKEAMEELDRNITALKALNSTDSAIKAAITALEIDRTTKVGAQSLIDYDLDTGLQLEKYLSTTFANETLYLWTTGTRVSGSGSATKNIRIKVSITDLTTDGFTKSYEVTGYTNIIQKGTYRFTLDDTTRDALIIKATSNLNTAVGITVSSPLEGLLGGLLTPIVGVINSAIYDFTKGLDLELPISIPLPNGIVKADLEAVLKNTGDLLPNLINNIDLGFLSDILGINDAKVLDLIELSIGWDLTNYSNAAGSASYATADLTAKVPLKNLAALLDLIPDLKDALGANMSYVILAASLFPNISVDIKVPVKIPFDILSSDAFDIDLGTYDVGPVKFPAGIAKENVKIILDNTLTQSYDINLQQLSQILQLKNELSSITISTDFNLDGYSNRIGKPSKVVGSVYVTIPVYDLMMLITEAPAEIVTQALSALGSIDPAIVDFITSDVVGFFADLLKTLNLKIRLRAGLGINLDIIDVAQRFKLTLPEISLPIGTDMTIAHDIITKNVSYNFFEVFGIVIPFTIKTEWPADPATLTTDVRLEGKMYAMIGNVKILEGTVIAPIKAVDISFTRTFNLPQITIIEGLTDEELLTVKKNLEASFDEKLIEILGRNVNIKFDMVWDEASFKALKTEGNYTVTGNAKLYLNNIKLADVTVNAPVKVTGPVLSGTIRLPKIYLPVGVDEATVNKVLKALEADYKQELGKLLDIQFILKEELSWDPIAAGLLNAPGNFNITGNSVIKLNEMKLLSYNIILPVEVVSIGLNQTITLSEILIPEGLSDAELLAFKSVISASSNDKLFEIFGKDVRFTFSLTWDENEFKALKTKGSYVLTGVATAKLNNIDLANITIKVPVKVVEAIVDFDITLPQIVIPKGTNKDIVNKILNELSASAKDEIGKVKGVSFLTDISVQWDEITQAKLDFVGDFVQKGYVVVQINNMNLVKVGINLPISVRDIALKEKITLPGIKLPLGISAGVIADLLAEIDRGETLRLGTLFGNNLDLDFGFAWDSSKVNTNKVGKYEITGKIVVSLNNIQLAEIDIVLPVEIVNVTIIANINEEITLPQYTSKDTVNKILDALKLDVNKKLGSIVGTDVILEVSVDFDEVLQSSLDTIGTFNIRGTAKINVNGIDLLLSDITVKVNVVSFALKETITLPEIILPLGIQQGLVDEILADIEFDVKATLIKIFGTKIGVGALSDWSVLGSFEQVGKVTLTNKTTIKLNNIELAEVTIILPIRIVDFTLSEEITLPMIVLPERMKNDVPTDLLEDIFNQSAQVEFLKMYGFSQKISAGIALTFSDVPEANDIYYARGTANIYYNTNKLVEIKVIQPVKFIDTDYEETTAAIKIPKGIDETPFEDLTQELAATKLIAKSSVYQAFLNISNRINQKWLKAEAKTTVSSDENLIVGVAKLVVEFDLPGATKLTLVIASYKLTVPKTMFDTDLGTLTLPIDTSAKAAVITQIENWAAFKDAMADITSLDPGATISVTYQNIPDSQSTGTANATAEVTITLSNGTKIEYTLTFTLSYSKTSGGSPGGPSGRTINDEDPALAEPFEYIDLPRDSKEFEWGVDDIYELTDKGFLNGVGNDMYAPLWNATRAEATKIIIYLLGIQEESYDSNYHDAIGHWAEKVIGVAKKHVIMKAYDGIDAKPAQHITREEMLCLLVRTLRDKGVNVSITADEITAELAKYSDSKDTSFWAADEVAAASKLGITTGYEDGTMKPRNKITRIELGVMMARFYRLLLSKTTV